MNFKDLLLRAKDGDQQAKEEIFLMYRPLLFKESCVNGIFDEDLFQELSATLIHCIRLFTPMPLVKSRYFWPSGPSAYRPWPFSSAMGLRL